MVDIPKGRGAFLDCVQYLTHSSEKCQEEGKALYPDSEVFSNFDWLIFFSLKCKSSPVAGFFAY